MTRFDDDAFSPKGSNKFTKHLSGQHDQANHGRKGPIKAGFANWNASIPKLLDAAYGGVDEETGAITFGQISPTRGNLTQAVVIEAAGFNGKPKILSEKEFDAIEGERLYRGVKSVEQVTDFKENIVQYAGEGYIANGTYTSNKQVTAYAYAGKGDESNTDRLPRIMEMKMLPTANVLDFKSMTDVREYAKKLSSDFITQYKESGANPQQVRYAESAFTNRYSTADWTNLAIMTGVDAVRFPAGIEGESYTVILNRGQVGIYDG